MKIQHICLDVDDTLYPASEKFKAAKVVQHTKRLIELLKEKDDEQTTELVEKLIKEAGFKELNVDAYKHLVETYGNQGNANLYKKLGVDHRWVERDVYYVDRTNLIDWSYGQAIIDTFRELKAKGIGFSLFSNSSYGSTEINLRHSGFTSKVQEELFGLDERTKAFAEEQIGETWATLDQGLRQGRLTQADFDYMIKQYATKMYFLSRGVNVLSAEDSPDYKKPATGGFDRISKCLDMPAEAILCVGDSPKKDIAPPKQVGMKSCYVLWGGKEKDNNADYVINKLPELREVVE